MSFNSMNGEFRYIKVLSLQAGVRIPSVKENDDAAEHCRYRIYRI